mmetsp:Transcript_43019/g.129154  ORF Transcript_43019/g.129154 Transcript_43019/m.129154 type:complete len:333 (+) Transcript_43019:290-1288(+)
MKSATTFSTYAWMYAGVAASGSVTSLEKRDSGSRLGCGTTSELTSSSKSSSEPSSPPHPRSSSVIESEGLSPPTRGDVPEPLGGPQSSSSPSPSLSAYCSSCPRFSVVSNALFVGRPPSAAATLDAPAPLPSLPAALLPSTSMSSPKLMLEPSNESEYASSSSSTSLPPAPAPSPAPPLSARMAVAALPSSPKPPSGSSYGALSTMPEVSVSARACGVEAGRAEATAAAAAGCSSCDASSDAGDATMSSPTTMSSATSSSKSSAYSSVGSSVAGNATRSANPDVDGPARSQPISGRLGGAAARGGGPRPRMSSTDERSAANSASTAASRRPR